MTRKLRQWAKNWAAATIHQPYDTLIPIFVTPTAAIALTSGDTVSRAFTLIAIGNTVAHIMGFALLMGGLGITYAIGSKDITLHSLSLIPLSAGCFIYGGGVIVGLGLNGLVAGLGYLAISVASIVRLVNLLSAPENPTSHE